MVVYIIARLFGLGGFVSNFVVVVLLLMLDFWTASLSWAGAHPVRAEAQY